MHMVMHMLLEIGRTEVDKAVLPHSSTPSLGNHHRMTHEPSRLRHWIRLRGSSILRHSILRPVEWLVC